MNHLKTAIDNELINLEITEKQIHSIYQKLEPKNQRIKIFGFLRTACILLCFLIGGTTVYAGGKFLYEKIMVNDQEVLPLDDMEIQQVRYLDASKNAAGFYETQLYDYDELRKSLGVPLLISPFAENNHKMIINYQSDNQNWISIKATAFIVGDATNLVLLPEYNLYNYTSGKEFGSPINLQIDIMTSKLQKETGWSRDFLGYYKYKKSYTVDGVKVGLVCDTIDGNNSTDNDNYREQVNAIFVSSGIRYVLSGRVSVDKMKEIVKSML